MARGVSVDFLADVSPFLRGTADIEKALDDVIDSLDDVATEAKTTGTDAETALKGIGTTAETESSSMESDFRRSFDAVKADSQTAGTDISESMRTSTADAKSHTDTFKGEASANFAEVASSFKGDMTTAVEGVQGLLGGLSSALPGPGAFAAGAAAIGLGIATGIWGKAKEEREKFVEQSNAAISSLFNALVEGQGKVEKALHDSKIKEFLDGLTTDQYNNLKSAADTLGVTVGDIAAAATGDKTAIEKVNTAMADAKITATSLQEQIKGGYVDISQANAISDQFYVLDGAIKTVGGTVGDMGENYKVAEQKANDYIEATGGIPQSITTAVVVDTDGAQENLNNWLAGVPDKLTIPVELEMDPIQIQTIENKVAAQGWRFVGP